MQVVFETEQAASRTEVVDERDLVSSKKALDVCVEVSTRTRTQMAMVRTCSNKDTGRHAMKAEFVSMLLRNCGHDDCVKFTPTPVSKACGKVKEEVGVATTMLVCVDEVDGEVVVWETNVEKLMTSPALVVDDRFAS